MCPIDRLETVLTFEGKQEHVEALMLHCALIVQTTFELHE